MPATYAVPPTARRLLAAWSLTLAAACGGDAPSAPAPPPVAVASVVITSAPTQLVIGESTILTAVTKNATGDVLTGRPITWESLTPARATVSANGTLTAVAAGDAQIRARAEGKESTVTVSIIAPVPAPIVSSIEPSTVFTNADDVPLRVTGQGFTPASVIHLDGIALTTTYVDAQTLTTLVPSAALSVARTATVTVSTPAPGGGTAPALPLRIEKAPLPAPTVTALAPSFAMVGAPTPLSVAITGTGFTPETQVTIDGTARVVEFFGATQLRVALTTADLATARTLELTMRNPGPPGGGMTVAPFTVRPVQASRVELLSPWGAFWTWIGDRITLQAVPRDAQDRPLTVSVLWGNSDANTAVVVPSGTQTALVYGARAGSARISAHADGGAMIDRQLTVLTAPTADLVYEFGTGVDRHLGLWQPGRGSAPSPIRVPQIAFEPSPSPDGSRIAYTGIPAGAGTAGNMDIYITDRDASDVRRLTTGLEMDYQPAWSPSGSHIAFVSTRADGLPDVWIMQADGSNPTRLTQARRGDEYAGSGGGAMAPAWSPDGSRLVYTVYAYVGVTPRAQLWVMHADGTGKRRLTDGSEANDFTPTWSPDGRFIVFTRLWRATNSLQMLAVDAETGMTAFPYGLINPPVAGTPAFSPDGQWLTMSDTFALERPALYAMPTNGLHGPRIIIPPELQGARNAKWSRRPTTAAMQPALRRGSAGTP